MAKKKTTPTKEATWKKPKPLNIKITKAIITKTDTLHIEYEEHYDDLTSAEIKKDNDAIVHSDLTAAFEELTLHLIELCDQKKGNDYGISGFAIEGEEETESVSIIGHKTIKGKTLKLTSPSEPFAGDYKFKSELAEVIERCKYEIEEYLNGKAAAQQVTMEFESDDVKDVEFAN